MRKNIFRITLYSFVIFLVLIAVHSCRKDRPDTDTQASVDNSICEGEFSRIFPQTSNIAVGDSGVQRKGGDIPVPFSGCPDHYIDSADIADGFPVTMWLYFGTDSDGDGIYETPCTGPDGRSRAGVIEAVFSDKWHMPGANMTMTLQNYFVNSIQYEGTVSVTRNVNGFSHTVTNGKCSHGSAWSISWNCSRTVTLLGELTQTLSDDVCLVSGSASGTDRKGGAFSVTINTPLRRQMDCPYITKGVQTIKIQGKKDRTIDYGDGTCDDKAKLIIDGNEFEFNLQ